MFVILNVNFVNKKYLKPNDEKQTIVEDK